MTRYVIFAALLILAFTIGGYVGETNVNRACYAFHTDLLEPVR